MDVRVEIDAVEATTTSMGFLRMRRGTGSSLLFVQVELTKKDVGPVVSVDLADFVKAIRALLPEHQVMLVPAGDGLSTDEPKVLLEREQS